MKTLEGSNMKLVDRPYRVENDRHVYLKKCLNWMSTVSDMHVSEVCDTGDKLEIIYFNLLFPHRPKSFLFPI